MEIIAILLIAGIVGLGIYSYRSTTDNEPVVETPTVNKLSKARLTALTKAQLEEKGKELGIDVDRRLVKAKIVNQVYKAQK